MKSPLSHCRHALADSSPAPPPPHAGAACSGAGDDLRIDDFILPLFVSEKVSGRVPVASMPGVFQLSESELVTEAAAAHAAGMPAVLLFGIPAVKDEHASQAYADRWRGAARGAGAQAGSVPGCIVITDVCLCEFMSHGHCGIARFQRRARARRKRRQRGVARPHRRLARRRRRRHRRPQRHDGRPRRRDPRRARCRGLRAKRSS